MNTGMFSEEKIVDESLNKYFNASKEDTAKSRSPVLTCNHFSFGSQEVLKLDLETVECFIDINENSNNCEYDDYEENQPGYSVYMNKGGKKRMEDRFKVVKHEKNGLFFGVYDGHGSEEIAVLLAEKLHVHILDNPNFDSDIVNTIINCFHKIDFEVLESQNINGKNVGSVVICAIIIQDTLYVINLGDSRAVMVNHKGDMMNLSSEHVPSRPDELERIEKLGGLIVQVHDQDRIMGELAVSRSIGDKIYKPYVSATPEVYKYKLDKNQHKFIVLASDGLWNEISNEELGKLMQGKRVEGLAKEIYDEIIDKKYFVMDNTTILCIDVAKILGY